jgi:hypothetical protein
LEQYANEGAAMLAVCGTLEEIALEIGVTERAVSNWRAGEIPNDTNKSKLRACYSIPGSAWRTPPCGATEPPWLVALYPALELSHPLALFAVERVADAGRPAALAGIDRQATKLRERYPELVAAVERAEVALGRAIALESAAWDEHSQAFLAATEAAA